MKNMRTIIAACFITLLLSAGIASAYPTLQLYIDPSQPGVSWDSSTEIWVASSNTFTLSALSEGTLSGVRLSIALTDGVSPSSGTVSINGSGISSSNYVYGIPPISALNPDGEGGDLTPHDIFPTYFAEYIFDFTPANAADIFDTQPGAAAGTKSGYWKDFYIDISGFNFVHFDLYTLKNDVIDKFAPFSHDAEYNPPIPEPGTMVLLGISLLAAAGYMRRMGK